MGIVSRALSILGLERRAFGGGDHANVIRLR